MCNDVLRPSGCNLGQSLWFPGKAIVHLGEEPDNKMNVTNIAPRVLIPGRTDPLSNFKQALKIAKQSICTQCTAGRKPMPTVIGFTSSDAAGRFGLKPGFYAGVQCLDTSKL